MKTLLVPFFLLFFFFVSNAQLKHGYNFTDNLKKQIGVSINSDGFSKCLYGVSGEFMIFKSTFIKTEFLFNQKKKSNQTICDKATSVSISKFILPSVFKKNLKAFGGIGYALINSSSKGFDYNYILTKHGFGFILTFKYPVLKRLFLASEIFLYYSTNSFKQKLPDPTQITNIDREHSKHSFESFKPINLTFFYNF